MIRFERLEREARELKLSFRSARPFPYVAIDDFCDSSELSRLVDQIPDPSDRRINKSRDYVFAKNKFEKSGFRELSPDFQVLYDELLSERMQAFLRDMTGEPVFVDPEFHGGGIHQGGQESFLDMHVDFNYHPLHAQWFRNLNILLYLNKHWQAPHGGQLKLRHRDTGEETEVEPLFNRCVIMQTREYTMHGYDRIAFPSGQYRRSIATYAYSLVEQPCGSRTTVWYPENGGLFKSLLGRHWPTLVRIKNRFLGSATSRNK